MHQIHHHTCFQSHHIPLSTVPPTCQLSIYHCLQLTEYKDVKNHIMLCERSELLYITMGAQRPNEQRSLLSGKNKSSLENNNNRDGERERALPTLSHISQTQIVIVKLCHATTTRSILPSSLLNSLHTPHSQRLSLRLPGSLLNVESAFLKPFVKRRLTRHAHPFPLTILVKSAKGFL